VETAERGRRLAYLCLETPRPGQAAHTHVHEIVNGLRRRGWQVELIITQAGGVSAGRSFVSRALDFAVAQAHLVRRLSDFDAVYIRSHPAAVAASMAARMRGVAVFQEVNGRPTDLAVTYPRLRPVVPLLAWAYRTQLARAAHVFAVTDGLADWVRKDARHDRVSVVPNGANIDVFRPGAGRSPIAGRYVIFVGGLVAWHGLDTMLAATRQAHWPNDVRLVLVGDGVERDKLEGQGAGERVLWLGRKPYEDLPALVGGAIAALCVIENPQGRSATGVAPIKMYEAMACATPVIVSDLPHQADLVRRIEAGVVVPMADPGALATAVADLAQAPATVTFAMGQRGRAYVGRRASWQVRADETALVMLDVLEERRADPE
jgi:glycosyltransferase involved in cell wall biosynthesis